MIKLTIIQRLSDGVSLAEGVDDDREQQRDVGWYKQLAKSMFKTLSVKHEPSRMSVEAGCLYFHNIIEGDICYLALCELSFPKKLAYQYLGELHREFEIVNRSQTETVARPSAFIKFDTFIQKTRKLYLDPRMQGYLSKLSDDLNEVQQIMTRNIQEVLGDGDSLVAWKSKIEQKVSSLEQSPAGR